MAPMKRISREVWHFLTKEDTIWSWLANIMIAFLLIRFLVYPLFGIILGTSFPIVAVVSESMEHGLHEGYLCGQQFTVYRESFDNYWQVCGSWYENNGIMPRQFQEFPFPGGFNKGDVIILWRAHAENIAVGDILIFQGNRPQPIIHRIVRMWEEDNFTYYQTKGDHNSDSISSGLGEIKIGEERIYGKGVLRIPYLGWVKILFVEAVRPLGWNIQR